MVLTTLRTIGLNNIVMTHVCVSGRIGESCQHDIDCGGLLCENKMCACAGNQKQATITMPFGKTNTMCTDEKGKWYISTNTGYLLYS